MNQKWVSLVFVATLCGCFIQYQPIALCVFSFHGVFLLMLNASPSWKHQWVSVLSVSLGLTVSMPQLFRYEEEWDWISVALVLALQVGAAHLFWGLAAIHLHMKRSDRKNILCYPTLVASAYSLMAHYSPIGSQASLGYGLCEWGAFIQVAALFGLAGLNFAIVTISTGFAHYWLNVKEEIVATPPTATLRDNLRTIMSWGSAGPNIEEGRQTKKVEKDLFGPKMSLILFFSTSIFGSFRLLSPYMYQKGVESTSIPADEWVETACVIWAKDSDPFAVSEQVLSDAVNTSNPVRLVLWSETAADYYYDDRETELVAWQQPRYTQLADLVANMSATYNATIGATYMLWYNPEDVHDDRIHNMLSFWDGNGAKLFDYTKVHPVPIVEPNTVPGTESKMASATTSSIGAFDAAICFDFDYPDFIRKSVSSGIIIQSANTWGMVGYFHGINSSFRAIENGAYLVRCGSKGPSGVWDPYGNLLSYQPRYGADVLYFQVPLQPQQIWTFYTNAGFVFDYFLYAFTILYFALFIFMLNNRANT